MSKQILKTATVNGITYQLGEDLKVASPIELGGIKTGNNLAETIVYDTVVNEVATKRYAVNVDAENKAFVEAPAEIILTNATIDNTGQVKIPENSGLVVNSDGGVFVNVKEDTGISLSEYTTDQPSHLTLDTATYYTLGGIKIDSAVITEDLTNDFTNLNLGSSNQDFSVGYYPIKIDSTGHAFIANQNPIITGEGIDLSIKEKDDNDNNTYNIISLNAVSRDKIGGIRTGYIDYTLGTSEPTPAQKEKVKDCLDVNTDSDGYAYVKLEAANHASLGCVKLGNYNLDFPNYYPLIFAGENDAAYVEVYPATTDNYGVIKIGYTSTENKYGIKLDQNDYAYVEVPKADKTTLGVVKTGFDMSGHLDSNGVNINNVYPVHTDDDGNAYVKLQDDSPKANIEENIQKKIIKTINFNDNPSDGTGFRLHNNYVYMCTKWVDSEWEEPQEFKITPTGLSVGESCEFILGSITALKIDTSELSVQPGSGYSSTEDMVKKNTFAKYMHNMNDIFGSYKPDKEYEPEHIYKIIFTKLAEPSISNTYGKYMLSSEIYMIGT